MGRNETRVVAKKKRSAQSRCAHRKEAPEKGIFMDFSSLSERLRKIQLKKRSRGATLPGNRSRQNDLSRALIFLEIAREAKIYAFVYAFLV
jgi:hypothetical protein